MRFRRVSNRYPCRVAEAYERDLERAAADSDEQVAATVAAWERARGFEPVDWRATGAEERDESGQHFEPAIVTFDISNVCLVYEDSEEGSDERRG